jgi:hypothetical protein
LASLETSEQDGEAGAEEERERTPRLLFDEDPHTPRDQVLQPGRLDARLLMEVHEDHPEQGETAQHVERVKALVGIDRGDGGAHGFGRS